MADFAGFSAQDFKVFELSGFQDRMAAIKGKVRPKLEGIGKALAPEIARRAGGDIFAHVAKHARRTVNPPDDTWVAFGPDKRGYKKDLHFKVAVSRHAMRFLFEAGPEYQRKARWAELWKKQADKLAPTLRKMSDAGWFKSEHDEEPTALLADLPSGDIKNLADALTRRRDGQLVIGRRLAEAEALKLRPEALRAQALATFEALLPLFHLR